MNLTRQTDYAIRILMYCAANDGRLSRISDVADAYAMSEPFLFKILQPLVENGLVQAVRGRNGGICLAKPAEDITLCDVIQVTENSFSMAECFDSDDASCPLIKSCGLNKALHEALDAFFDVLKTHTIRDLVKSRSDMRHRLRIATSAGHDLPRHAVAR